MGCGKNHHAPPTIIYIAIILRLVEELCWEVPLQGYVQICHVLQQKCRSCWAVPEIKKMMYIIFTQKQNGTLSTKKIWIKRDYIQNFHIITFAIKANHFRTLLMWNESCLIQVKSKLFGRLMFWYRQCA